MGISKINSSKMSEDINYSHDYMLCLAKVLVIDKTIEQLTPNEIVRLAFINPSFKTLFSTTLQNEQFFNELIQLEVFIHQSTMSSILIDIIIQELNAIDKKLEIEKEYIELNRQELIKYCDELSIANPRLTLEKAELIKTTLQYMNDLIKNNSSRINILENEISFLVQKNTYLEGKSASLVRERAQILLSALTNALTINHYEITLYSSDKNGDADHVKVTINITRDEIIQRAKEKYREATLASIDADWFQQIIRSIAQEKISERNLTGNSVTVNVELQNESLTEQISLIAKDIAHSVDENIDHKKFERNKSELIANQENIGENDKSIKTKFEEKESLSEEVKILKNQVQNLERLSSDPSLSIDDLMASLEKQMSNTETSTISLGDCKLTGTNDDEPKHTHPHASR